MNDEDPELIAMKRAHGKYDPPKKPTSRPPMPTDPATVAAAAEQIANVRYYAGRPYLEVCGFILAFLGDPYRDTKIPEDYLTPIPQDELASASIGDKKAADLPIEVVRFFRGDSWNESMMRYVADAINKRLATLAAGPEPPEVQSVAAALENARLRAELAAAVEAGIELGFDCRHGQTSGGLTILGLIQEMGSQIAAARAEIEKCHGIIAKRIEAKDDELAEAKAERDGWAANAREVAGHCAEYLLKLDAARRELAAWKEAMSRHVPLQDMGRIRREVDRLMKG